MKDRFEFSGQKFINDILYVGENIYNFIIYFILFYILYYSILFYIFNFVSRCYFVYKYDFKCKVHTASSNVGNKVFFYTDITIALKALRDSHFILANDCYYTANNNFRLKI